MLFWIIKSVHKSTNKTKSPEQIRTRQDLVGKILQSAKNKGGQMQLKCFCLTLIIFPFAVLSHAVLHKYKSESATTWYARKKGVDVGVATIKILLWLKAHKLGHLLLLVSESPLFLSSLPEQRLKMDSLECRLNNLMRPHCSHRRTLHVSQLWCVCILGRWGPLEFLSYQVLRNRKSEKQLQST